MITVRKKECRRWLYVPIPHSMTFPIGSVDQECKETISANTPWLIVAAERSFMGRHILNRKMPRAGGRIARISSDTALPAACQVCPPAKTMTKEPSLNRATKTNKGATEMVM